MTDISDANRFSPPKAELADPAPLAGGPVLAGRGMRLVAVILDGVLFSLIVWPVYFMLGSASLMANTNPAAPPDVGAVMSAMFRAMAPGYLIAAVVQGWSLYAFSGTLGKKLTGLRIVRTDGSRATFVRLFFGRGGAAVLPACIPLLGGLYALVDMLMIFRRSRQCLHDQIADTIVVTAASSMNATLAATRAARGA